MNNFSFIPAPKNAAEAAFQARVMDRARNLVADGYKLYPGCELNDATLYGVLSPEGKIYVVNIAQNTCGCDCCKKNKYCKHLIACHMEEDIQIAARDEATVAAYEADYAACEDERTGVGSWY